MFLEKGKSGMSAMGNLSLVEGTSYWGYGGSFSYKGFLEFGLLLSDVKNKNITTFFGDIRSSSEKFHSFLSITYASISDVRITINNVASISFSISKESKVSEDIVLFPTLEIGILFPSNVSTGPVLAYGIDLSLVIAKLVVFSPSYSFSTEGSPVFGLTYNL